MYATINDAAAIDAILAPGKTKIWYTNDNLPSARDMRFGDVPEDFPKNIQQTHVLIGSIAGSANLDDIFAVMQGEVWSPEGEARDVIRNSGTYHTSMSVGDVIEDENGIFHVVSNFGFKIY